MTTIDSRAAAAAARAVAVGFYSIAATPNRTLLAQQLARLAAELRVCGEQEISLWIADVAQRWRDEQGRPGLRLRHRTRAVIVSALAWLAPSAVELVPSWGQVEFAGRRHDDGPAEETRRRLAEGRRRLAAQEAAEHASRIARIEGKR